MKTKLQSIDEMSPRVRCMVGLLLENSDIIDSFVKGCVSFHWGHGNVTIKLEVLSGEQLEQ